MTTKGPAELQMRPRPTVITLRPSSGSSLQEITLIRGAGKPREITLMASNKYSSFIKQAKPRIAEPSEDPLACPSGPDSAVMLNSKKIPRPPNAFMIFANEWRKRLAHQHPGDSNKSISVRLGQLWKNMSKEAKEVYYQRSRQAGQDHKQKYPGYVYNPKEARLRKALREQTRGSRSGGATSRWTKHPLTMSVNLNLNHHRQSLVSPVLLPQQPCCADNTKAMLHEQVDRDGTMLQSYPDYLDLPYNMPSADTQAWYPSYMQPGAQTNGGYVDRASENKLPVDWSTPYNSEHGNFIRASPQSSPYSLQNQVEVNSLMLNGERAHPHTDQTGGAGTPCTVDLKPVVDQILPATADSATIKDPEQQVKELLASAKVICEGSPLLNGKQEESGSTRLPGFHQAFGSTEIGRFSQPDGFFEAAVAAENERKLLHSPGSGSLPSLSPSLSSLYPSLYLDPPKTEPDLFGFTDHSPEPEMSDFLEHWYDPDTETLVKTEVFEPQDLDLSTVASLGQPPVIISQNDNCCVVLESSALDNHVKEYFSL